MRTNYLGKSRLSVVIALSAASVAFAQSVKDSTKSKDIEQVVLVGKNLTQVAKERKRLLLFLQSKHQIFKIV